MWPFSDFTKFIFNFYMEHVFLLLMEGKTDETI